MIKKPSSIVSKLNDRIAELEDILRRIEQGETPWEGYTYYYGYLGQEQYIKSLAKHALYGTEVFAFKKEEFAPIDHTYLKNLD